MKKLMLITKNLVWIIFHPRKTIWIAKLTPWMDSLTEDEKSLLRAGLIHAGQERGFCPDCMKKAFVFERRCEPCWLSLHKENPLVLPPFKVFVYWSMSASLFEDLIRAAFKQ